MRFQQWTNLPEMTTAALVVGMIHDSHILRFVVINGYHCKVWYKGQPLECDICSGNHKAASCPHKGKCIWCGEKGHFARNCPNLCNRSSAAEPAAGTSDAVAADPAPVVASDTSPDVDAVPGPSPSVDAPAPDSVVVVIDEGGVGPESGTPSSALGDDPASSFVLNDRFNELDEIVSQRVLQNCVVGQIGFDFLSNNGINSNNGISSSNNMNSDTNVGACQSCKERHGISKTAFLGP